MENFAKMPKIFAILLIAAVHKIDLEALFFRISVIPTVKILIFG